MPSLRSENGSRVAIDDLGGKILGHNIQYDGHHRPDCDPTASLADVNKMVLDASIVAIIGTTCSVEAQQVIPVVTARGLSMMSPSNTLPSLTDPGTGYFRVSWDDSEQGELAAAYAYTELSKSTAATIHDGSAYSASIAQSFAQKFIDLGGSISVQKTVAADQTDFRTELNAIAVSNAGGAPDMIFMPLFTPASGYVVNQARATTSLSTTFLMGTDVAWDELLMLSTGTDVDGFRFTNVDESQFSSAYATFKTTYHTKYGADPDSAFAAYGYDAFNVVAAAITSSATDLSGGAYLIGRKALRDALYSTSAYAGLTGTITCATDGECGASPLPFGVFQIQKNVWPPVHVYP
jgi:branched-chain amino acid transport system substrate-binding protein